MATRKIRLSWALMNRHMNMLQMNMRGARTAILRHIW